MSFVRQILRRSFSMLLALTLVPSTGQSQTANAEKPATSIRGEVTGRVLHAETKQPLSDVEVRLLPKPDGAWIFPLKPQRVRSNAQGEYRFTDLSPGEYRVYAFHRTLASRTKQVRFNNATIEANGQSKPVDLTMREGLKLKVHVVAEETGKPIPNALVRLQWTDQDDNAQTDETGTVVIGCLTKGEQHVEAMATGYCLVDQQQELLADTTEITFRLPKGGVLEGTITDPNGKPIAGVDVSGSPERRSMSRFDKVETDEKGRFKLQYLPLAEQFRMSASKKGYVYYYQEQSLKGQPSQTLAVRLEPRPSGGDINALVVDVSGKPIVGAEITNHGNSSADYHTAKSDETGRFTIKNLYIRSGNRSELTIRAEGFAPLLATVPEQDQSAPVELQITLEPGHRLKGRVVNTKGQPIAGAWVFFANGNRGIGGIGGKLVSDKDGRFASNSLPADCPLNISAQGYSPREGFRVALDKDEEVSIVLEASAQLRWQVVHAKTGKPVDTFNVKLGFASHVPEGAQKSNGMNTQWMEAGRNVRDPEGRFVWAEMPTNTAYDAIITAEGFEPYRVAGQVTTVDAVDTKVELKPIDPAKIAEIAGRIVDADGKPLAGVVMHLLGVDPQAFPENYNWSEIPTHLVRIGQANLQPMCRFDHHTVTDAQGHFKFPKVSTNWDVEIVYWGNAVPSTRVSELHKEAADKLTNLELMAPAGVTVIGTIDSNVFPNPSAAKGTSEAQRFDDREFKFVKGKPATEFTLRGLPDGDLTVALMGQPVPIKIGDSEGFSVKVIGQLKINARPGDTVRVHFDGNFLTK